MNKLPCLALSFLATSSGFVTSTGPMQRSSLRMSDEPPVVAVKSPPAKSATPMSTGGGALVPIKEETVEFAAGLVGGFAGFLVGGPLLGAIGAAAANYASKMENDAAEVVQAVSKSSIQVFNYLSTLDAKYGILNKAKDSLQNTLDKLKNQETVDKETVGKVESALSSTKAKLSEINDEYDLVGGGMTALGVLGDLVEKAIKKAGELNEEYKLTDKAQASLKSAVEKAKEATKD